METHSVVMAPIFVSRRTCIVSDSVPVLSFASFDASQSYNGALTLLVKLAITSPKLPVDAIEAAPNNRLLGT